LVNADASGAYGGSGAWGCQVEYLGVRVGDEDSAAYLGERPLVG